MTSAVKRKLGWLNRWGTTAVLAAGAALAVRAWAADAAPAAGAASANAENIKFFEEQVKPILQNNCVKCHGGEKTKGGLKLTTRDEILKGGEQGPAAKTGTPDASLILVAVSYKNDDLQMPPKKRLPAEQVEVLTKWVRMGLPWTPGLDLAGGTAGATAGQTTAHVGPPKPEEARDFWSFRPVKRPNVPQVKHKEWVRNPVDAFILAKLEEKGFTPAAPADKVSLLRRAYYDLTGLPPTPAEVEAFLADQSAQAFEKVVDRLLDSPHYGEKWGRHWLDLVRFAETNSYERDNPKPNAWRYRDYVIRSFNADKPYDRFLKEQLAGDELPDAANNPDDIIATGYYRLGIWDDEPTDRLQAQFDGFDDIVATTGQTMLGLTFDCARCHDHKIDPILQSDYYKLVSFFRNINHFRNGGPTDEQPIVSNVADRQAYDQRMTERMTRRRQLEADIAETQDIFRQLIQGEPNRGGVKKEAIPALIREEGRRVLGAERYAKYRALQKELDGLNQAPPAKDMALCVTEAGPNAPETFITVRGNANVQGAKVEPGFPAVLGGGDAVVPPPAKGSKTTGRRTVLANWIASKDNPMTARVMANRVWQFHFGRGIVRSSNNFGLQGDKPTHPELLDYLADEFVASGWRLKAMHRLIMTSNAYRMASTGDPKALAADPQNDLFWRFDLRRLTAEEVRDSVLAVNGTINLAMYGPSVYPPIPKEVLAGQSQPGKGWETSGPADSCRRSVYVHVKRSLRPPIIEAFDGPETDRACPVRFVTVQPTQALGMMNGSFLNDEAAKFAARVKKEAGADVRKQVALALRLATCRTPTDAEVRRGMGLIEALEKQDKASPEVAMKYYCLMVLNLNEFVYLD